METLDLKQKAAGMLFIQGVMLQVMMYLSSAFQWANHQAGVSDEAFWRGLFLPTQKDPILRQQDGKDPDQCPEQPYANLDLQACVKYLLYGGERRLPGPEVRYAQDSVNVLRTFGLECRSVKQGGVRPKPPYLGVLHTAVSLRNRKHHADTDSLKKISLESLEADLKKLENLTEPLTRKDDWLGELQPLPAFWEDTWGRFQESFGCSPISLEELGQEIFLSDEERLTPEQRQSLEAAAQSLGLDCRNGNIYGGNRQELKKELSAAPVISMLLGTRTAGAAGPVQKEAPAEMAVSPSAVPEEAAALLRRGNSALPQQKAVLSALLDHFTLLVDESLFLAAEGRELLNERLAPLLMKRKERLRVDESVVNALFRTFRGSTPCSPLELSELALSGLDQEQIEDMQAQRREEHRNCKTAIKALRLLRQKKCLEVIFSPTGSTHSYDNIQFLTEHFPAVRFLVLTMDRQLAGELKGRINTVSAKPDLDGQALRLYQAAKTSWQALLSGSPAMPQISRSVPVPPQRPQNAPVPHKNSPPPPPPVQVVQTSGASKQTLAVNELPRTGSTIMAVWPDGTRRELRLGRPLGKEGGEGAVYTVGGPEPLAAKIYHRNQVTQERQEKLLHMVRLHPDIPGLCWPNALVFNRSGEWTGFLMPRVEARELCQTVYKPGRDNRTIKALHWDRESLVRIAANTAGTFAKMHRHGILMGDINPRNFMVGDDCSVYFVDCDSYQFGRFPCPVRSDRYTPPEILREVKRSGQENYNYIRTLDHERYSMAVVLFEILMLGKSPYESRNTDSGNVLEAIMDGGFPYPFRAEGEEGARRADQAPAGRWREIWSHMPYQVKACFYNAFTGKIRQSAAAWEQTLLEYVRLIGENRSTRALLPEGFKNVDGTMLTKVCSQCGAPYTIDEETYLRRTQRREPALCPTHYTNYHNYRTRKRMNFCAVCGGSFETSVALWLERGQQGKPMYCRNCVNAAARCSACGKDYTLPRDRLEELNAKKTALLCPECLELQHPTVTCEAEGCQRVFRTSRQKVEQMRRMRRPLLCPDCLERMRGG